MKDGVKHGVSRYTNQGTIYEGEFKNDHKTGKGRLILQDQTDNTFIIKEGTFLLGEFMDGTVRKI